MSDEKINDENKEDQFSLFGNDPWWHDDWKGMPEFVQNDLEPYKSLIVHFEKWEDVQKFAKILNQTITAQTKSLWYPESEFIARKNKFYIQEEGSKK